MSYITTGLTNGGVTTHYKISYDNSLSQSDGKDRANNLIAACENDFTWMQNLFGGIDVKYSYPMDVHISPGSYARASWGPPIDLQPGNGSDIFLVRYLLVSEVTEMFMEAQNKGWFGSGNEGSAGEGLSRFLASQFLVSLGRSPVESGFDLANSWMSTTSRKDYVNNVDPGDHSIDDKTGCAILFIYYLFVQLGFSLNQIVAAADHELAGVYKNLTGDAGDPFPYFKALLDAAFPGTNTIGGSNPDNPYPLGALSFGVDKSTFGKDEVKDVLAGPQNGVFPKAFWLFLDGFNTQVVGSTQPALSGQALSFLGISITPNPSGPEFQFGAGFLGPQRVRFPYDVTFTNPSLAAFPAKKAPPIVDELDAAISLAGAQFKASAELEFIAGADPYFTNIDPTQDNVFYLSQDLRVFTATPALNNTPVPGGPIFGAESIPQAYIYIQQLIAYLNTNFADPAGVDPFDAYLPGQGGALTGDSSVTPFTLSGFVVHANFNFALARVRLRGPAGEQAKDVRVFFRLWSTQTADTDFDPGGTYPSHLDASSLPDFPLPASDAHTMPFFATGNSPSPNDPNNPEYGNGGVNNRPIKIPSGVDSHWAYYGCFLNIYDPANAVNGQPVQALLTGTHHCLVAQIASDDAPIIGTNGINPTPENSDKLAQRNLQVTHSDNPGPATAHRIPQTFDIRPSQPLGATQGDLEGIPDELMIDWGNTPPGSTATIYWPQVSAAQVLDFAARLYSSHPLSAADSHTIQIQVTTGITYVPIPPSTGPDYAGLLTIDLPVGVVQGQEFNIILRRMTTREEVIIEIQAPRTRAQATRANAPQAPAETPRPSRRQGRHSTESRPTPPPWQPGPEPSRQTTNWRYVTGSFQVKIPVSTAAQLLWPEENTLAIFKWRLQQMSPNNRWYPVLVRYIQYLSGRVQGLGGDPTTIQPSPTGVPAPSQGPKGGREEFTGKVCEVIYDCFGDLEGFVLCECEGEEGRHMFKTRQKAIGKLAIRALKAGLLLCVYTEKAHPHTVVKIVVKG